MRDIIDLNAKLDRVIHILQQLAPIQHKEDAIMSALTDLQAAVAALSTAVTAATTEITTLLGKIVAPGTSDADVEAAVTQIQTIVTGLNAAVADAQSKAP